MSKVKHHSAAVPPAAAKAGDEHSGRATRETIESIAVAVILAFLFRAFVAEAFVIPTGSMAPTLQGRHMDVTCSQCGCPYRAGASVENEGHGEVRGTTCPICRFPMQLDKDRDPNQRSFNGDRILVSKFAYEVADPKRWEVIVFKFPGNAKQNYIKRLIGLPNETLWIRHGDISAPQAVGHAASGRRHAVSAGGIDTSRLAEPLAGLVRVRRADLASPFGRSRIRDGCPGRRSGLAALPAPGAANRGLGGCGGRESPPPAG